VSHKAFKEALTVWCNQTGSQDLAYGSYIVQSKVNQCPMKSRGDISPHTLYYGHPPANSYSTVLGQAYGKAQTEFSLHLAKKFLGQVKEHLLDTMVPQDHIEEIIEVGDRLWHVCAEEDRTPMESEQMLFSTLLNLMGQDLGVTLEATPTFMLMEEERVEETQQEELVWHLETECFEDELYAFSDNAVTVGGSPVDDPMDRESKYE
jgi:hypothetical protein